MQMPNSDFLVEELICNESFQQFCLGDSLPNQLSWQNWIDGLPHKRGEFEEAKRIVEILSVKQGSRLQQIQALKSGLQQQLLLSRALKSSIPQLRNLEAKKDLSLYYKYIGGVAALLIMAMSVYFLMPTTSNLLLRRPEIVTTYSSGKLLRKTVLLADGTVITLSKESSINLSADFNKGNREIWLNGEAFFDVKHDKLHPFVIHTSFNVIRVLGTAFNVKAYPHAKEMETILLRGSVRVNSKKYPGSFVILKPNEKLTVKNNLASGQATAEQPFQIAALEINEHTHKPKDTQWIQNKLEIENESLSSIARKLQLWYGVEIEIIDDAVKDYHYSGVFEEESILKTLEALQLSFPFKFVVVENKIIISK